MGMGMREYGRGGEDGEDGVEDDGERGESWRPQRTLYNQLARRRLKRRRYSQRAAAHRHEAKKGCKLSPKL
ncbi:hypothetical protein TRV_02277 [Trichophyton verrucosum HKI 0517]|uniref:Uncharacterized protein n=1 Tax=Trichophyton verrucosum (strain HKI 0517) TaxID=663202 RepID=D4D5A7_TRIVH|nr:uncharacterized protein TRV_02277 [Trichophyton verrucosum HKI 0517]EFE42912.1 hypothetical protein TRV_02277 [Trichophyton verrucosum HKI 0517]